MKLLFVRHGESEDDLLDAYGGWADWPLTKNGKSQIENTAEKIGTLEIKFKKILSSPLQRAKSSAEIISQKLNIPFEVFEYLKERNTYGLLSGMIKADAKEKYPWLVDAYKAGEFVDGSERTEDVNNRAVKTLELLKEMGYENLIVVTHGNFLRALLPQITGKKLAKKADGGFILLEVNDNDSKVLSENGIVLE